MEVDAGFFRVCRMRGVEGIGLSLGSGPLLGGTSTVMMEPEEVHWSICEGGRVPLPKPPPPVDIRTDLEHSQSECPLCHKFKR